MNIGESLGKAFIVNDMGAAGSMGSGGSTVGFQEESPFCKLMSQMMAAGSSRNIRSAISAESGPVSDNGETMETDGMDRMTAALILGGAAFPAQTIPSTQCAGNPVEAPTELIAGAIADKDADSNDLLSESQVHEPAVFDGTLYLAAVSGQNQENRPLSFNPDADALNPIAQAAKASSGNPAIGSNQEWVTGADAIPAGKTGGMDEAVTVGLSAMESTPEQETAARKNHEIRGLTETHRTMDEKQAKSEQANPSRLSGGTEEAEFLKNQESVNTAEAQNDPGIDSFEEGLKTLAYQSQYQSTSAVDTATASQPVQQSVSQPGAPEAYSQIREEILSRLEQKGPTEFKMQLQPEELGQIDISLRLAEGKLVIDIVAANSNTQTLLAGQVDKLIASLGLQNVQVESIQTNQQMNSQNQDNSQSQGYSMNSGMDFSQRKQQEQYQQNFVNNLNHGRGFGLKQEEARTVNPADQIDSIRYGLHRMNYAV